MIHRYLVAVALTIALLPAQRQTKTELVAANAAKVLASAVFVSERDPQEALENSVLNMIRTLRSDPGRVDGYHVDRERRRVRFTISGVTREARFCGDQGCVIVPADGELAFEPVEIPAKIPDPAETDWPMGDRLPAEPAAGVDHDKLGEALDHIFDERALTAGCVIVHRGRLVAERYGQGGDRDRSLESWSMGKSLTAILYGRLLRLREQKFDPDLPAPIPSWPKGDPRRTITVGELLRMSSGLRFSHLRDPEADWQYALPDHFYIYAAPIDVFAFAASAPVQHPPNTVGTYRNCDPLLIGSIVRRGAEALGHNYLEFPQRALFDALGIDGIVLEPDLHGNFIMTGFEYGTPRDWARLGLLVLQDGKWEGERLLPEGFSEFVSSPAPAWRRGNYGGLFWVNGDRRWQVPESAYYMAGHGGQYVIVVPTHQLVIARMGHQGGRNVRGALNRGLRLILEAIQSGR